jgi:hypothetical protein
VNNDGMDGAGRMQGEQRTVCSVPTRTLVDERAIPTMTLVQKGRAKSE